MGTATRGNLGEAAVLKALIQRDFDVLVPFGSGQPYDLVVDLGDRLFLRLQCKTAWRVKGCMTFNCRATDHGQRQGALLRRCDIFGVYFPADDSDLSRTR